MAQTANPTAAEPPIEVADAPAKSTIIEELVVPKGFLHIFPQPTHTVRMFLDAQIPRLMLDRQIGSQRGLGAMACVVTDEANFTMDQIFTADVPPKTWIEKADGIVTRRLQRTSTRGRSEKDERTNVCHPTNSELVFPPWIVKAWRVLINIVEMRDAWQRSLTWIENQGQSHLAGRAKQIIEQLPWASAVEELSIPSSIVYASIHTRIASRSWLHDDNFEVLIKELNEVVADSQRAWISETTFMSRLRARWRAQAAGAFTKGGDIPDRARQLVAEGFQKAFLPTHINKDHWIVFKVDLTARTISWGDSRNTILSRRPRGRDLEDSRAAIKTWMSVAANVKLEDAWNSLPIGKQIDDDACGIFALNAIECDLSQGHPIATTSTAWAHRMRYFIAAIERLPKKEKRNASCLRGPFTVPSPTPVPPTHEPQLEFSEPSHAEMFARVADHAPRTHRDRMAFNGPTIEEDFAIVRGENIAIFNRDKAQLKQILSRTAKEIISALLRDDGLGAEEAREPPYMRPSTNPDDYSQWCSACNDFGGTMVLCAGCRVAACCGSGSDTTGCLEYDDAFEGDDFVYYCEYCNVRGKWSSIEITARKKRWPHKMEVLFRSDPAVIIVSLTWHLRATSLGKSAYQHLAMKYKDHEHRLLLVEIKLDGKGYSAKTHPATVSGMVDVSSKRGRTRTEIGLGMEDVVELLQANCTARIVVIVSTHCMDDTGMFVWGGTREESNVCTLQHMLSTCLPQELWKLLSSEEKEIHRHRTLVVNLACGAVINVRKSRKHLYDGLDVDAILSFANAFTVVGEISTEVSKFILGWVTSRSDYDVLIAKSFTAEFASLHRPVISQAGGVHTLYTGHSFVEPRGHPIICLRRKENGDPHDPRHLVPQNSKRGKVIITCKYRGCNSTCEVAAWEIDKSSPLGHMKLVSVSFPPEEATAWWSHPDPNKSSSGKSTTSQKGSRKQSKQATHLAPSPAVNPAAANSTPVPPSHTTLSISVSSVNTTSKPPNATQSHGQIPVPPPTSQQLSYHRIPGNTGDAPRTMVRSVRSTARLTIPSQTRPPPDSPSPSPSPTPNQSPLPSPALSQRSTSSAAEHSQAAERRGEKRQSEAVISGENRSSSSKRHRQGKTNAIVDLLRDDEILLRSCSLVSKSWVPRTRRYLFEDIGLSSPDNLQSWRTLFPNPSTSPAYYAKALSIGCPQQIRTADAEAGNWLRAFSRIVKLEIDDDSDLGVIEDHEVVSLAPLSGIFPNLKTLDLHVSAVTASDISDFIYSFPQLDDIALTLSDIWMGYDDADHQPPATGRPPVPPPFAGVLTLHARMGIYAIASRLFFMPSDLCFRDVLVVLNASRDFPPAAELINGCWRTLEYLELDHHPCPESQTGRPIHLSRVTNIRRVVFGTHLNPTWVTQSLQSITDSHRELEQITIRLVHPLYNLSQDSIDHVQFWHPESEALVQAWFELDRSLIRFQEAHPAILLRVLYRCPFDMRGGTARCHVGNLLPGVTKREGVEVTLDA